MPQLAPAEDMMRYYARQIVWLRERHNGAKKIQHKQRLAIQIRHYKAKLAYFTLAES